jgi:hypothetical protein
MNQEWDCSIRRIIKSYTGFTISPAQVPAVGNSTGPGDVYGVALMEIRSR